MLLRTSGGVIRRRDHPELRHRLDRLIAKAELIRILPGILTTPTGAQLWEVRLRAGLLWAGPDAVLTRYAAARSTFWRDCTEDVISFAKAKGLPRKQPGWPVQHAEIPAEWICYAGRLPVTRPAYTAVDLAAEPHGGDVIDRALRERCAALPQMRAALVSMRRRDGNRLRARLLDESRDSPWSELERRGHRLLRRARLTGWRTNVWIAVSEVEGYFVDVLFGRQRLIVEFDGWEFHGDREAFERDRRRRNSLVLLGYRVLNFTWRQVVEDPDWVIGCVRRALQTSP